eukprot:m.32865 g.32865  ORF g.32865 m.32865 type:complete len:551 (+) comp8458_c0_seq4:202-1854(+)
MDKGFRSRRSDVFGTHGIAASSQPLASQIGLDILKAGGNAADAAVAMAAALNVTEPCSTGIGGDCFCLYFDAKTATVKGINGSGRTPKALSLERVRADGILDDYLPEEHAHTITVPGAVQGWCDTLEQFGTMDISKVLKPAIDLAEDGFPVHQVAAAGWAGGRHKLVAENNPHGKDMLLPNGQAPSAGDLMFMPKLAQTFREIAEKGAEGFYKGRVAEAIIETVQSIGGVMTMDDLASHESTIEEPIYTDYRGHRIYEMAPNGQGLTALMALNILEFYDLSKMEHNSTEYLHHVVEALRLSFADASFFITDPTHYEIPLSGLLSKKYAESRRKLIKPETAGQAPSHGSPHDYSDTVYFSVVDGEGNACSFINSNYMGFGTGLVPAGCGFTLQNRAAKMSLDPSHPNSLKPGKRPYHTIIPGMATKDGNLFSCFGVMGGYMQPQGHVQVLCNMIDFGMTPQEALDAPRVCIGPGHTGCVGDIVLEEGISSSAIGNLKSMGHSISLNSPVSGNGRSLFGRGQIIAPVQRESNLKQVLVAGSDPRGDGVAAGW